MVVGTTLAGVVVATGGAAAAAGAALGTAAGATGATVGTGAALGTAVGVSTAGGAIAGTAATGTAAGAALGTGLGGLATGLVAAGPVGWITLGAAENKCQLTFDCWKPVLHDSSPEPSNGTLIRDIVRHPNISSVVMETTNSVTLPPIILENVWREKFEIQYFVIKDTGRLVAHANPVA